MPTENVIHLRLDYSEAITNKKEILSSEINLINLYKIMKQYHELRNKELDKKIQIQKQLKLIKLNVIKLSKLLPVLKIPKILKKEESTFEKIPEKRISEQPKVYLNPMEKELQTIQEQLRALEAKA
jgi:hypothetical protein